MTSHHRYINIRDKVLGLKCSHDDLEQIKLHYLDKINSRRRYELIRNLPQLVKVLEKRDVLNEERLEGFQFIANHCNDKSIQSLIDNKGNEMNFATPTCSTTTTASTSIRVLPEFIRDNKARIYKLISEEIGAKWKDMARSLEISEAYIEDLQRTYPKISERMYEILLYSEEHNSTHWKSQLLNALSDARRNDLKKKVLIIMERPDI